MTRTCGACRWELSPGSRHGDSPPCELKRDSPQLLEPDDRAFLNVRQYEHELAIVALALDCHGLAKERQEPGFASSGGGDADADSLLRRLHGILPADEAIEIREEDVQLPADSRDVGRDRRRRVDPDLLIRGAP